jgi:predicted GIY-YIG superfamily endonuclease
LATNHAKFWVYILENRDGKFYIGHTDDLDRRLSEHNDPDRPKRKFTPKYGPWRLAWFEEHPDRASAMARETEIKAMKSSRWIREKLIVP